VLTGELISPEKSRVKKAQFMRDKVGDRVHIRAARVNSFRGEVDFELVK